MNQIFEFITIGALAVVVSFVAMAGVLVLVTGTSPIVVKAWEALARARPRATGRSSDTARLRGRMKRLARPTLLLTPATQPGVSRLGGDPDLPDGMAWPELRGRPCAFLAQIDLSALRSHAALDWLPGAGQLFAFVDLDGHGFADQVQVLFHDGPSGELRPPPARTPRFPERRVAFEAYTSLPSLDWLGVDLAESDLSEGELDELAELPGKPFGDEIQHRIGGYPSEIQDEQMAVACELIRRGLPPAHEGTQITPAILRASKAWRLLLQIDSDPALKMDWADGGRLYVFVREQDAKDSDFSATITLSQSD